MLARMRRLCHVEEDVGHVQWFVVHGLLFRHTNRMLVCLPAATERRQVCIESHETALRMVVHRNDVEDARTTVLAM